MVGSARRRCGHGRSCATAGRGRRSSSGSIPPPTPGPGEILVRASASVCNYNEVDGCHGRYLTVNPPLPYTLGMEYVGVVVGAGDGAEQWIGRRVMGVRDRGDRVRTRSRSSARFHGL